MLLRQISSTCYKLATCGHMIPAVLYFGVSVTDEWQSITQLLSVFTIGMSHLFLTRWIKIFKQKFYEKMNANQWYNYCWYLQSECNVCLSLDGVKCLNKSFLLQNKIRLEDLKLCYGNKHLILKIHVILMLIMLDML